MPDDSRGGYEFGPVLGKTFLALLRQQHDDGSVPATAGIEPADHYKARLTHHLVTALVACDCLGGASLERALRWFTNLPSRQSFGVQEMNQLEALLRVNFAKHRLSIAPPFELMRSLIEALIACRDDGSYIIGGISRGAGPFASLWAIKVLDAAADQNLLPDAGVYETLKTDIGGLSYHVRLATQAPGRPFIMHKDIALALKLKYRLHGGLDAEDEAILHKLFDARDSGGGLWDVEQTDMRSLVPRFLEQGLAPALIGDNERSWRTALVGTCYVIENLMPLREAYPNVVKPIRETTCQLLDVLSRDSFEDLRTYFPSDHGYIQIACRLLVAAQAVLGSLSPLLVPYLADESSAHHQEEAARPLYALDEEGIIETMRKWFKVTYEGDFQRLTRGFSGAHVVRVRPRLAIPSANVKGGREHLRLPGLDSLVVKYGSPADIEAEVQNCGRLPERLRERFATMPEIIHSSGDKVFTVIQDLVGFEALEEFLPKARNRGVEEQLAHELVVFLRDFHTLGMQLQPERPARVGLARRLYLEPAWRYLGSVFPLLHEPKIFQFLQDKGSSVVSQAQPMEIDFRMLLASLHGHEGTLNEFSPTYMHGDLHARNIMLRTTGDANAPFRFRFIDLENVTADGDYAYDIGELCASLSLYVRESGEARLEALADNISQHLQAAYQDLATANDDQLFAVRLELARCRASLRIAHGKSKEARLYLDNGTLNRATDIVRDAFKLVDDALTSLRQAVEWLGVDTPDLGKIAAD
ncbi:MAG: aminoglycoside phosphotransferase family protein [Anaerolineae bacterium]|nr:aminoglycoside phosphotransferase family protein [Anaerolineae bacterium]